MPSRAIFGLLLVALFCGQASAKDLIVFDVRKNLPLSDNEPVYRDFYINGGTQHGLQKNMVVEVVRRTALYDAYQNKSPGDLLVSVGQLKVIHAQGDMAVAREFSTFTREDRPVLEHNFILVGDRLDMSTAAMAPKRVKKKRKTAKKKTAPKPVAKLESKDMASKSEAPTEQPKVSVPVIQ